MPKARFKTGVRSTPARPRRGRQGPKKPAASENNGNTEPIPGEYPMGAWPSVVDAVVDDAVRDNMGPTPGLSHYAGVELGPNVQGVVEGSPAIREPSMMACVCDALGSEVSLAVKEKVWKGEFVDLGGFARVELGAQGEQVSLSLVQAGHSLQIKQDNRTPRVASIEQWTSAFLVFASIFVEKHAGRARELFKYMDIVRSIVRFGGYNWRTYDTQFRLRQARQPLRSWAAIDAELWLTVATAQPRASLYASGRTQFLPFRSAPGTGSASASAPGERRSLSFSRRNNYCFAFNTGFCQRGASCRYAHVCSKCSSASHPATACASSRGGYGTPK